MSSAQIHILRGADSGKRVKVSSFPITIGRDPKNSLQISDQEISRFHCRIKKRGRLFILEDLESKNGIYLNGDKVLNAIVQNQDKILIGTTELVFHTSAPEFFIANEILNFDLAFTENETFHSPIEYGQNIPIGELQAKRLNLRQHVDAIANSQESTKKIFNYSGDFLVKNEIQDTMDTLIKIVGKNISNLSRAVIFITFTQHRKLVPVSLKRFDNQNSDFTISHRALQDVINRKQPLLLSQANTQLTQLGPARALLPIISDDKVIAVIHLESEAGPNAFPTNELAFCQAIISRISPIIDNVLLRKEIDAWMLGVVESMIATIEAKDTYTVGHSERVCKFSMAIAEQLKLNKDVKKQLMISSLCHDIGKIGIPDSILKKASMLSNEEYDEMKLHPTIGAKIIEHMPNARRFLSGIKYHHEKWDGTGYPEGLVGEDIPFFGRIVAVADAFDAMISGRSYSGFIDEADAVQELATDTDLFDPEILKAFTKAWENGILTPKTGTQANQATTLNQVPTKPKK